MRCDACAREVIGVWVTSEGDRWCLGCLKEVMDVVQRQADRLREIDAFMERMRRADR